VLDSGLSVEETLTGMISTPQPPGSRRRGRDARGRKVGRPGRSGCTNDRHLICCWGVNLVDVVVAGRRVKGDVTNFAELPLEISRRLPPTPPRPAEAPQPSFRSHGRSLGRWSQS
jgi:hypothetical protein